MNDISYVYVSLIYQLCLCFFNSLCFELIIEKIVIIVWIGVCYDNICIFDMYTIYLCAYILRLD